MAGDPVGIRLWLNRAKRMRAIGRFPENILLMVNSTFEGDINLWSFRVWSFWTARL